MSIIAPDLELIRVRPFRFLATALGPAAPWVLRPVFLLYNYILF